MPRWMFFAPLIGLIAAAAVIGLSLGRRAADMTEAEVMSRVAARYVAEAGPGAASHDCAARLATSDKLWMVVSCAGRDYFIDRFGKVADVGVP